MTEGGLAIATYDFAPDTGGVQNYLQALAQRLAVRHPVTIVTPNGRPAIDEPYNRVAPSANHAAAYWRALRSVAPGIILVGHVHPQLLLAASFAGAGRTAVLAHGNDFLAAHGRWHWPLTRALLGQAGLVVANSDATRRRLHDRGIKADQVIRPGTDPGRFRPAAAPATGQRWLTVGRLVARKGIDVALDALRQLRGDWPELHYDIVGDGPERRHLESLVREMGLHNAVTLQGRLPDAALPEMYRQATLFVMPASEADTGRSIEGFGIVFLEAAASGLPVVAVKSGGVAEAVDDGVTGLLVPPGDSEALAMALRRLMTDPALARQMGRAGRRRVENYFTWDRVAEEWEQLLFKGIMS